MADLREVTLVRNLLDWVADSFTWVRLGRLTVDPCQVCGGHGTILDGGYPPLADECWHCNGRGRA